MSILSELLATDETIAVRGREYTLSPLCQMDLVKIEARILGKRQDPVALAQKIAPAMAPEDRRELFQQAYQDGLKAQYVTAGELDDFLQSVEGAAYSFWLALRKHHPEMTEEQGAELLEDFGRESLDESVKELQAQFADAMPEEIKAVAAEQETGLLQKLFRKILGLPSGN